MKRRSDNDLVATRARMEGGEAPGAPDDRPREVWFGPFRLDRADESLWRGTDRIALAPKTFALLRYLVSHPDRLVTKDELLDEVWPDSFVADGALKVRIRELRGVLGDDPEKPGFIATVHRRGYRFVATVRSAPEAEPAPRGDSLRRSRVPGPAPIGREADLARLADSFDRAGRGERQVVFVTGEPGIGKSAVVDAFAASLTEAVIVGRGQCLEYYGTGEAYLPVLEALAEMARGAHAADVVAGLRRLAPTWLTHLPWLVTPADRDLFQRELRGATRERMLREMAEVLELLSSRAPVVIVLEDLHWSDPSTLDLLALLAHRRQSARLLVLGTYRPVDVILSGHGLKGLKQRLDQQQLCREVPLPYLMPDHVALYLRRRLDATVVPPDLAEAVFERTAGNPLFLVSLVNHMIDCGWLVRQGEGWELGVPASRIAREVPEGLRQMIEQQLDRLSAEEARVLEVASVVGEEFSAATVAAVLDREVTEVEAVCEAQAQRRQLLKPMEGEPDARDPRHGRYGFSHALQRDVLYRRLGPSRRTELHRRIAEQLERTGASPSEIALHFFEAAKGGGAGKAIAYSRKAAERSTSLLAFAEAVRHLEMALDALALEPGATGVERGELLVALGQARDRAGAHQRAIDAFLEATELARAAGADRLFARAALEIGRGHHMVGQLDERLVGLLEEALARVGREDRSLRACLLARLDTALSPIAGTHERREALASEAIAIAEEIGDPETLLWVFQYTRWGFVGRSSARDLRKSAEELERLAERVGSTEQSLYFHLMRVADLAELGDAAGARSAFERFHELSREAGIPWFLWFALRMRTLHALAEGRLEEADGLIHETLAVGQTMDHPNVIPLFGVQTLMLRFLQGRVAEVEDLLVPFLEREPGPNAWRAFLADVYARQGRETDARREFETLAADDFAGIPRDSAWLIAMAHLAAVAAALGDRDRAAVLRDLIAPFADRVIGVGASIASLGHGSRYLGLLAQTLGDWDEATRLLDRALEVNESTGARPWAAYTLLDQGRLLLSRPLKGTARASARARAERALGRAGEIAVEVGMAGLEREIAALRGGAGSGPVGRPRSIC